MTSFSRIISLALFASSASSTRAAFVVSSRTMTSVSSTALNERLQGTCKWFNTEKGFGFITPADGSADVFVHQTSIQARGFRSLADGENVEFEIATDPKTGKAKAVAVTGPGGVDVQGAPFSRRD